MKYGPYIIFMFLLLSGQANADDKALHFLAGSTIGSMTYAISREHGRSQVQSINTALWVTVVVGLTKEAYDASKRNGKADLKDATATGLGGLIAPLFISSF